MFSFSTLGRQLLAGVAGLLAPVVTLASAHAAQVDTSGFNVDPALYVLEADDHKVYLFGTFHVLPSDLAWNTDKVASAFLEADTLILEADAYSPQAQASMQPLIGQLGLDGSGTPLAERLSAEARTDLAALASTLGVPAEALEASINPMRPWLASVILGVGYITSQGFDPNSGVDQYFFTQASTSGSHAMLFFETAEQQLNFFANIPDEVSLAALEASLDEMATNPAMLNDLLKAWAEGDMDTLDRLVLESMSGGDEIIYETLIASRNYAWVESIETMIDETPGGVTFIAVGAAHLPGEQGVVELLRNAGFGVEEVE